MFLQQLAIFLLEGFGLVMRLLVIDVTHQVIELTIANGKIAVTALPEEIGVLPPLSFDPCGGGLFDLLQQIGLADRSGQPGGEVNVVGNASNAVSFAPAIAANSCQICMHSWSDGRFQPRVAALGAKDDVNDYLT